MPSAISLQQDEHLQLALKAGRLGTWELTLPDKVLTASSQCKQNFGRAPDDPFTYDELINSILEDDRHILQKALNETCPDQSQFTAECRCCWPDGSVHWINVNGGIVLSGRARKPHPEKMVGVTSDITAQKQSEHDLREAQLRITSLLDAVDVGTWSVDLITDRVNPDRNITRLFFLTDEAAHGPIDNYLRVIHPDDRPRVDQAIAEVLADPDARYKMEYRLVGPKGQIRWIDIRGEVERSCSGKPILFRGVALDISERKSAAEFESRLALSYRLMSLQDDERRKLGRELHDGAGQTLAALGMNIEALFNHAASHDKDLRSAAEQCRELTQNLIQEIRTTSYLLHPPMLDEIGLSASLSWYVRGLQQRAGLEIALEVAADFPRLDEDLELVIFRVVQESLTNVYRHSGSKTASVRLESSAGDINLSIEDAGSGIPPERLASAFRTSVGIQGMRERVRRVGGRMEVNSRPGCTTVACTFPAKDRA